MQADDQNNAGKLNVWIENIFNGRLDLLWSLEKSTNKQWREGLFSYQESETHRIIFEGVRGLEVSDIGLGKCHA